ncbi:hypothetical protein F2Q68_00023134 [Brassica cretica]|nr:hypothetical protein F2Q68_00023134 [Brassica cretica]
MRNEIQNETAQTDQTQGSMFSFFNLFPFLLPMFEVIKMVVASVASVVYLGFAGVTLSGSAVALAVSTPLFIIFSPILLPAIAATTVLAAGLGSKKVAAAPAASPSLSLLGIPESIKPSNVIP